MVWKVPKSNRWTNEKCDRYYEKVESIQSKRNMRSRTTAATPVIPLSPAERCVHSNPINSESLATREILQNAIAEDNWQSAAQGIYQNFTRQRRKKSKQIRTYLLSLRTQSIQQKQFKTLSGWFFKQDMNLLLRIEKRWDQLRRMLMIP